MCVVGDEDQSIYSWRGADIRNILDFERDFPKARTIRLEQNYRSTKNILAAAGAVVENNKERKGKKLWTEADAGTKIGLYAGYDAENEALFIADTIEKHLASNPQDHVAVLYRTNFQSRQIEEALRRYGRKYNIVGGFSFYQRAEIKDMVAYLKLAMSNSDSVSLLRVINTPARGIGRTTVEQIEKHGARPRPEPVGRDRSASSTSRSSRRARNRRWWRSATWCRSSRWWPAARRCRSWCASFWNAPATARCWSRRRRRKRRRAWRTWTN